MYVIRFGNCIGKKCVVASVIGVNDFLMSKHHGLLRSGGENWIFEALTIAGNEKMNEFLSEFKLNWRECDLELEGSFGGI